MSASACTLWRTGSVLNRSFTATVVPTARAAGAVPTSDPVWSYVSRCAGFVEGVRVVMMMVASAHKELRASPLNPNVLTSCRNHRSCARNHRVVPKKARSLAKADVGVAFVAIEQRWVRVKGAQACLQIRELL